MSLTTGIFLKSWMIVLPHNVRVVIVCLRGVVLDLVQSLKVDITFNAHVGSVNVGTVNGHANVGRPGGVTPFHIQVIVGLEGRREARVVGNATFPFQGEISVGVDCGGDAVVGVNLLGKGDFLVVRRGGELDVGLVVGVVDHHIAGIVFKVEARGDGDAGAVGVQALGGFDGAHVEGSSSRSDNVDIEVEVLIVGVDLEVGIVKVETFGFGTGRNAPSRDVGAHLAPDALGEGSNVSGRTGMGRDPVGDVHVTRTGGAFPGNGGVQAVQTTVGSITDRKLSTRAVDESSTSEEGVKDGFATRPMIVGAIASLPRAGDFQHWQHQGQ